MASSSFLVVLLKCIDFLSWPVLALGYPLCASIEAIETDGHSETRNLISYWILLSFIYLFEYAFLQLLQWFQYWHYMKLMIVAFLVIPDFGRAAYVYNHLIQSCIYMNPKEVISRFRNWKNIFAKKQDIIKQVENYVTQNGTEALDKLIAGKNTEQSLLHAEIRKEFPTTTEKNEILKTNQERLLMEQKDIKDLQMIEKEEVPEGKQDNAALDSLKSKESTSSTMVKAENIPADTEHGTHAKISAAENVQKEWTCAICQLTMASEANLNSHLQGRKHKAACEALNTKKIKAALMKNTGTRVSPQVSASAMAKESTSSTMAKAENMPPDTEHGTHVKISAAENVQKEWTCAICKLTLPSEANLNIHLHGRKHKAACEALNRTKIKAALMKNTGTRASPQVSPSKNAQNMRTCAVCQLTKLSEDNMKSHLKGKKHKAACDLLNGKSQGVSEKGLLKKNDNSIGEQEKKIINTTTSNGTLEQKNITNNHHPKMEHNNNINQQKNVGKSVVEKNSCIFRCDMCDVNCTGEGDLASHLQGKKHLAQIQLLSGSI